MFATANSKVYFHALCRLLLSGVITLALTAHADSTNTGPARWVAQAQQIYAAAQARLAAQPTNTVAAWEFGRAAFDRAEFATNDTERATLAEQGIAACRAALARDPKSAAAHYYLGMNLGQLARTKTLGALKIVDEMEAEFQAARALDERLDHAGPDRNLGLLYLEAPRIVSLGNKTKARRHLSRAVALAPDYPENRLNLAEAAVKWRETRTAQRELAAIEALWPSARTNFAGPKWEASWADWDARLEKLKAQVRELSRPLLPPRAAD